MLTEESKMAYIKRLEPLHFLPRRIFGDSLPDDIYTIINKCLVIPEFYFIWMCGYNHRFNSLPKTASFKKCMLSMNKTNSLLRILIVPSSKMIPAKIFAAAQAIFVFHRDKEELKELYKRAKCNSILDTPAMFCALMSELENRMGLVIQRNNKIIVNEETGAKTPFQMTDLWYTTDIARQRS